MAKSLSKVTFCLRIIVALLVFSAMMPVAFYVVAIIGDTTGWYRAENWITMN